MPGTPNRTTAQSCPGTRRRRVSQPSYDLAGVTELVGCVHGRQRHDQVLARREQLVVGADHAPGEVAGGQVGVAGEAGHERHCSRPRSAPVPAAAPSARSLHAGARLSPVADDNTHAQTIAYPAPGARPRHLREPALPPHVIVLFGATGDLSRRKLLPGSGPPRAVGAGARHRGDRDVAGGAERRGSSGFANQALDEFSHRAADHGAVGAVRRQTALRAVSRPGPRGWPRRSRGGGASWAATYRRLHYLSVPPAAAPAVIKTLSEAPTWSRTPGW